MTDLAINAELASTGGYLKTPRAALYAGVSPDWLRHLASFGRGPRIARRLGRQGGNFYALADLDAWVAAGRGLSSGYEPKDEAAADPDSLPPLA